MATILVAGFKFLGIVPMMVAISFIGSGFAFNSLIYSSPLPAGPALIAATGFMAAVFAGLKLKAGLAVGITGAVGAAFVGYLGSSFGDFQQAFKDDNTVAIILFLILLPLANGLLD